MRILHLVSCRGWSSDAYWAARAARELERRGHEVTLGCRAGTEARVIERARREGVSRVTTFAFAGGLTPRADVADARRLAALLPSVDLVHVHRGKEHWLAAAANRWLYREATAWVVTVTEAIRRQYLAAGLLAPGRVTALPGGADTEAYRPLAPDPAMRARLGGDGAPLVGMIAGLRVMKGHAVVIDAAARLAARGVRPRVVFVGQGGMETAIREAIARAGLEAQVAIVGFVDDLPRALGALDVALYVPLESDGMSRVVFEVLAAGRPLVASRVGVVPEVLADGVHAALVPAGDAPALAGTLAGLLEDAGARERLGRAGRRLVEERYSGARLGEALEARYRDLAAGVLA